MGSYLKEALIPIASGGALIRSGALILSCMGANSSIYGTLVFAFTIKLFGSLDRSPMQKGGKAESQELKMFTD